MRKYLVTNVVHMNDCNHFSPDYAKGLQSNKKEYHMWKTDLTVPFTEARDATVRNLRPNFETMKK